MLMIKASRLPIAKLPIAKYLLWLFLALGALMIVVSLSIFPILAIFLAMQKQFVQGLLGSIK